MRSTDRLRRSAARSRGAESLKVGLLQHVVNGHRRASQEPASESTQITIVRANHRLETKPVGWGVCRILHPLAYLTTADGESFTRRLIAYHRGSGARLVEPFRGVVERCEAGGTLPRRV